MLRRAYACDYHWRLAPSLLVLAAWLGACGAAGPRPPVVAAPAAAPETPLVLEPSRPAARNYNDPAPASAADPFADRIVALVTESATALGIEVPQRDARLDAVCADLGRVLPDDRLTPFALAEFALEHAGIIELAPHLLVATVAPDAQSRFESDLKDRLPTVLTAGHYRRLGIGAVPRPGGQRLVLAFQEVFVSLQPFPRELPRDGRARLHGRVDAQFRAPRIYVTEPSGRVETLDADSLAGDDFTADFDCIAAGRHQIEIVAEDSAGPTVLANFPIYCGVTPPPRATALRSEDLPVEDPRVAEQQLLTLLNAERQRHDLPALAWQPGLAEVARAHSRDMLEHHYVGHVSTRTGSAGDRLQRAGIPAGLVLENVVRAYSTGEAQRGLLMSPAHRRNLFSRQVTHVGIGVVLGRQVAGRPEVFVTELLISLPEAAATGPQ